MSARGRYALTELDQGALFQPLTKWNKVLDNAAEIPATLRAAFRNLSTGRPGAGHIGLPFDVQRGAVDENDIWADPNHGQFPSWPVGADPDAAAAAAAALLSAKSPLIIVGGGVVISAAQASLQTLAEALDAPVATTISGQGAIAEDHPLAVGVVGSNGGVIETRELVEAADLVFFVSCRAGSVTTERWRYPAAGKTRIVHLDSDPGVIGANYPTEVAVVADARLGLDAIVAAIGSATRSSDAASRIAAAKKRKFDGFNELAFSDATPIRPERVIASLQRNLPADAVIVADPGTPCPYVSGYYEFLEPGRHFISNRAHGALGYSMSGAVGAQLGRPNAMVVALMGDGSFGFTAGELETIVRLGVPITMVVFSNSVFGWIKAGQRAGFGERYFSVDFNRTDHAKVAEAFGVKAWTVADPNDLDATLKAALAHDGPSLVDIIAQPLNEARAPVSEWIA